MNDYERIARVIRYLDHPHTQQPSLGELARACGLGESQFHRLLHRWAGITSQDFPQCLTLTPAQRRLQQSASVLEAAPAAGLSGPGRLHNVLVTLEAPSPGEFKRGGEGVRIAWGLAESPFGGCLLGWNPRGVCHLTFRDTDTNLAEPRELRGNWPQAELHRNDREARRQAERIFNRETPTTTPLQAFVHTTPFQFKVWQALLRIPEGGVASYGSIATAIGHPRAARAVGTACAANPIAYLIPCHRVVRATGVVEGYRWGTVRKRALLVWEAARTSGSTEPV